MSKRVKAMLALAGIGYAWGATVNHWLVFFNTVKTINVTGFQLVNPDANYSDWVAAVQRLHGT